VSEKCLRSFGVRHSLASSPSGLYIDSRHLSELCNRRAFPRIGARRKRLDVHWRLRPELLAGNRKHSEPAERKLGTSLAYYCPQIMQTACQSAHFVMSLRYRHLSATQVDTAAAISSFANAPYNKMYRELCLAEVITLALGTLAMEKEKKCAGEW
jgi:hypothetical protein